MSNYTEEQWEIAEGRWVELQASCDAKMKQCACNHDSIHSCHDYGNGAYCQRSPVVLVKGRNGVTFRREYPALCKECAEKELACGGCTALSERHATLDCDVE